MRAVEHRDNGETKPKTRISKKGGQADQEAPASLPIVQTEVFGPVLTMQVFDTEAEAVALANDSEYGLSASIWTRDADRPFRIARKLQAGTIWINDWAVVWDEFEEGGFKQSGVGRLNGVSAIDDFLEYKHIAFNSGTISKTLQAEGV